MIDPGKSRGFPNKALLEAKIGALADHAFVLDVSSVATPRLTMTGTEKYHEWQEKVRKSKGK